MANDNIDIGALQQDMESANRRLFELDGALDSIKREREDTLDRLDKLQAVFDQAVSSVRSQAHNHSTWKRKNSSVMGPEMPRSPMGKFDRSVERAVERAVERIDRDADRIASPVRVDMGDH